MAWRSPPSSNPASPTLNASNQRQGSKVVPLSLTEAMSPTIQPLTLVIPTIRAPKLPRRHEAISPKIGKTQTNRLRTHRPTPSASIDVLPPAPVADSWAAPLGKFDIEQDATELEGYQMYAVEKW